MSRFLPLLPWALVAGGHLPAQAQAIEPVLRAELAFARLADEKGIRTAFLTWLAEDARVFAPRMTRAKDQYGPEPGDRGHLVWYPEAMGVAESGELAWSFGPWTYAAKKGDAVRVHDHFLSVWRRQADGGWKVEADIGVPHAAPERPVEPFAAGKAEPAARTAPLKILDAAAVLRQKEAQLTSAWAERGGMVLLPDLAKEARVLRPGRLPVRGAPGIQKVLEMDRPAPRGEPALIQVAASGDLAWTCGESGPDSLGAAATFLRIWVQESDHWKVLFDVRLPIPKPKG